MEDDLIIRWTFGEAIGRPTSLQGLDMLECSIRFAQSLIPNAKLYVCYNSIRSDRLLSKLNKVADLGVSLIDQNDLNPEFTGVTGKNSFWKYIPGRIELNKFELFLDNDVIIWRVPELIKTWAESNSILISEDWNGSHYGEFAGSIQTPDSYNAGIIGLPPGFEIPVPRTSDLSEHFHSEQGYVASQILQSGKPVRLIKKELIYQANHFLESRLPADQMLDQFSIGHFCGCTYCHYVEWDKYFKEAVWNYFESMEKTKGILK